MDRPAMYEIIYKSEGFIVKNQRSITKPQSEFFPSCFDLDLTEVIAAATSKKLNLWEKRS
jgi:hypothetical protein